MTWAVANCPLSATGVMLAESLWNHHIGFGAKSIMRHSSAWLVQVWLAFAFSVGGTSLCIAYLPVDAWMKLSLSMGLGFTVSSTLTLAKTTRDQHESKQLVAKVEEAKVEQLLAQHR